MNLSLFLLSVLQIHFASSRDVTSFACGFNDSDLSLGANTRSPHNTGQWFRWTDGKIPYYFKGNVKEGDRQLTRSIMKEIESHTCFKYIPHDTEPEGHHLEIVVEAPTCYRNGFSAYVQPQQPYPYKKILLRSLKQLTDHESCDNRGGFMHEMMHALGVGHTQKRADRDKYIIVNENNIQKLSQYSVCQGCRTYKEVPYDCSSIMHYGQGTFSVGGPTMVARNPQTCKLSWNGPAFDIGQPAQSDWKLLELLAGQVCNMNKAKWSAWSEWSACSEPCGDGRKTRRRTCSVSGKCQGESQQEAKCSLEDIYEKPEDCLGWKSHCGGGEWKDWMQKNCARTCNCGGGAAATWSSWGRWSACRGACGDGKKTRTRTCSGEGKCSGDSHQTSKCDLPGCDSCFENDIHHVGFGLNKPGGDNNHGATGSAKGCQTLCQKTAGCAWFNWVRAGDECWLKIKKGTRTKKMPGDVSGPRTCETEASWSPWGEWSGCSATCGDGTKTRTRTCSEAGKCSGDSKQTNKCDLPQCATWSSWGRWSACRGACGDGKKTRTRTCSGEGKCSGDSKQTDKCDLPGCDRDTCETPNGACILPFTWSGTEYNGCTKDGWDRAWCRTSMDGSGKWYGVCPEECKMHKDDEDSCFENDIHHVGFGLNKPGGDNNHGATGSAKGCQSVCQKTAGCAWFNWVRAGDECWLKTKKGTRTKKMPGDVTGPRTCQTDTSSSWSEWGEWSGCSATCGDGTKTRTRTCSEAGKCSGDSQQTNKCDLPQCEVTGSDQLCSRDHSIGKRNFQILDKINQYRSEIGRSQLECHAALVTTALHHTRNQMDVNPSGRGCNLHSWLSAKHLGKGGKKCCYKSNHSRPNCMWKKPEEILGRDALGGYGFEISYAGGGGASPEEAFKGWRRSSGHNNVMASNGMWKDLTKVGCYYEGNYANCWFAK